MAGSFAHIVDVGGKFRTDLIENLGDAFEALEECYEIIRVFSDGKKDMINDVCSWLNFPEIKSDLYKEK